MIERHAHELAAVIVEPLQRVLLPEPGFLEAVREATRRHGIVLVFDEIVTGFRIAWGGAQEKYGVVPDLACYGKAVSGGFPLAAIAGRADVMAVLDARSRPRADVVWATNTLNGNPVCAAAGCAALDVLSQPGVYDRLARIGARLRAGIVEAGTRHGFAVQAPGEDAVFGVRFTDRRPLRTWMDLTTADKDLGYRWAIELLKRGLVVNPNEKFYISIAHTDADVDRTLGIVDDAFAALRAARAESDGCVCESRARGHQVLQRLRLRPHRAARSRRRQPAAVSSARACGAIHYQNPKVVVGCLPEWKDQVLLCRRAIEPRHGLWTLPAGFLENGETVAAGAVRETLEEAGARVARGRALHDDQPAAHQPGLHDVPRAARRSRFRRRVRRASKCASSTRTRFRGRRWPSARSAARCATTFSIASSGMFPTRVSVLERRAPRPDLSGAA